MQFPSILDGVLTGPIVDGRIGAAGGPIRKCIADDRDHLGDPASYCGTASG
jgi:hypothetical protein